MHCMLMDLLHGFEVLSTTEETLFNSRNVSRLVQNNPINQVVLLAYHKALNSHISIVYCKSLVLAEESNGV